MEKERLLKLLNTENRLLANPAVFSQMLEALDDPGISLQEVAEIISRDQTTVANILRLVNSAAYGLHRKVNRIEEALSLLGLNTVMSLVLSTGLMSNKKLAGLDLSLFWRHTIATSQASQFWAHCLELSDEHCELSITLGLIHDIGRLWLWQELPEDYVLVTQDPGFHTNVLQAEYQILGIDHSQIGGHLARSWNWPELYQDVIESHHHPANSRLEPGLTLSVFLGNLSAHAAFPESQIELNFAQYIEENAELFTENQIANIYLDDWEESLLFLDERRPVIDAFLQLSQNPGD